MTGLQGDPDDRGAALPLSLFEAQVVRTPGAPALLGREGTLSYGDLNRRANRLARYLAARNVDPGRRVAMCFERSFDTVVGLLAILKTGAASVPVDMTLPVSRKLAILRDSRPAVLLTAGPDAVSEFDGAVVALREARAQIDREDGSNLERPPTGDAILSVLYTSGVTGHPKGVVVPATAIVNHMRWMWHTFPVRSADVGLLHRSCMLISSTWDYFGLLLRGIPSVVVPEREAKDPLAIWKAVVAHGVSHVSASPAFWDGLLDQAERCPGEWRTLRFGTISGEQVSVRIVRRWQKAFPGARLLNVYGSTECVRPTVFDTSDLAPDAERVPIGAPLPNIRVHIVDEELRRVPEGALGEICVSGPCLARGYLNLPVLTDERFVPNARFGGVDGVTFRTGDIGRVRPDGNLEVVGRRDQQVKIRGFRVELGDVEAALLQSSAVRHVAVIPAEDQHAGKRLVAYVVPNVDPPPSSTELREFLSSRVPDYMVPAFFVAMKELPLTRSGKTDWSALPAAAALPDDAGKGTDASLTTTEQSVAAIWSDTFKVRNLGRDDDFFNLGGDSLAAMQIAGRVVDAFGVELSMDALLSARTVKALASRIDRARATSAADGLTTG